MRKNRGNLSGFQTVLLLTVAVFGILWLCGVFNPPCVEEITVQYEIGARETAAWLNADDVAIVRESGLYQRPMAEFAAFYNSASAAIGEKYGYLFLRDVSKTGRKSVLLVIGSREPLAVLTSGGNAVVIDADGNILDTEARDGLSVISGVSFDKPIRGRNVYSDTNRGLLDDAVMLAALIRDYGYGSVFPSFTMCEQKKVILNSYREIPVSINLRFDALHSLDIANEMLQSENEPGRIEIAGNNGYFTRDETSFMTNGGM